MISVIYDIATPAQRKGFILDIRCPRCGASWQITDGVDPYKVMDGHDDSICRERREMNGRLRTKKAS